MTKEKIGKAINAQLSPRCNSAASIVSMAALQNILNELLCTAEPRPACPNCQLDNCVVRVERRFYCNRCGLEFKTSPVPDLSPAPSKSSTTEPAAPAKDRAEELAENLVNSFHDISSTIVADALRAYADEVLEKAARLTDQTADSSSEGSWMKTDVKRLAESIRSLQSTAKGVGR